MPAGHSWVRSGGALVLSTMGLATPGPAGAVVPPAQPQVSAPAAPGAPTATPGHAQATVKWKAPDDNGSAIMGYVVTPFAGATAESCRTFNSAATTEAITGLVNGTTYTFAPTAGTGLDHTKLVVHVEANGTRQISYNGHLLYRFVADQHPGDATGQGLSSFSVLSAAGDAIP